jgi:hypothetical protein
LATAAALPILARSPSHYTGGIYVVIDFGHENSLDLPDIGVHGDHVVREIVVDVASMLVVNLVASCSAELTPQMRPPIS